MNYSPLSDLEEEIGKAVVNAAFRVHMELGPGLLEKVYEACMAYELRKAGYDVKRQVDIPFFYDGLKLSQKYNNSDFVYISQTTYEKYNAL